MKKILFIIVLIVLTLTPTAYAFWGNNLVSYSIDINIGEWRRIFDGWDLDVWEENNDYNKIIPENQPFTYKGNIYIVIKGANYNPEYHGFPGDGKSQWAYVATDLDWIPNVNYRANSVVIRNERYFIANQAYHGNSTDWYVNDPLTHSGNANWYEWREIEPLNNSYFSIDPILGIIDYRANIKGVIYK